MLLFGVSDLSCVVNEENYFGFLCQYLLISSHSPPSEFQSNVSVVSSSDSPLRRTVQEEKPALLSNQESRVFGEDNAKVTIRQRAKGESLEDK